MTTQEQEELWYYESLVSRSLFFTLLAVAALVLGWFGLLKPPTTENADWFAKSGAFATIASLWANRVESYVVARYGHTGSTSLVIYGLSTKAMKCVNKWLSPFNFLVMLIGAFVCGYGDVIYSFAYVTVSP